MNSSNYLDNLIQQWDEESKKSYQQDQEKIEQRIKQFHTRVKKAERNDKILYPLFLIYFLLRLNNKTDFAWPLFLTQMAPMVAVIVIAVMQFRSNYRLNKIPLSLTVKDFFAYRYQVLEENCKLWKFSRYLIYPSMLLSSVGLLLHQTPSNIAILLIEILLKVMLLGGLFYYIETKYKEVQKDKEAAKY